MTGQLDLLALANGPMLTPGQRRKLATRTKKHGHAWPPGTGPADETCGSCRHLVRKRMAKTYIKCGLMRSVWTGGSGTDIRSGDPSCKKWEGVE